MAKETGIEWCDSTFNPWIGCTAVSPGCDNCYASRSTPARVFGVRWGAGEPRRRTAEASWAQPRQWNDLHEAFLAQHGRRRRVFCASLADVFDNDVPAAWRADLFEMILATPHLDWLLLTKRIGNVQPMLLEEGMPQGTREQLPANVWLGMTAVNQQELDRDLHKLVAAPASTRFLSIEPMLGPMRLRWLPAWWNSEKGLSSGVRPREQYAATNEYDGARCIDWIIAGGESGPGARPPQAQWFRDLRADCDAAGIPFFFKQWGGQRAAAGGCDLDGLQHKAWPAQVPMPA